jgi:succinoglycan biosynthesis transport protein ExoP
VLSGTANLDDVIISDADTGLDVLPVAQTTFTPRDVFGSSAFEALLDQLRQRYDQVILDTAPVLAVADTRAIVSRADGVLVAVRWKKSSTGVVRKAIHEIEASKANILGVVLNNVDLEAQARYGYDQGGYYYRSYQKYYSD